MTPAQIRYRRYLASPEWRKLRTARLVKDSWQCTECGATTRLDVHHLSYPRHWGEEDISTLIVLCRTHHQAAHKNNGGNHLR